MSKITYKVMGMAKFGGDKPSIMYKIDCDCGDEDHVITFELEREMQTITLTMHQNIGWSLYHGRNNCFGRFKQRISNAFKVLFFGHLEGQATLILSGEEHIQNFIDALEEGREYVKRIESKNKKS